MCWCGLYFFQTCSKCLQKGHTKRTCSNEIGLEVVHQNIRWVKKNLWRQHLHYKASQHPRYILTSSQTPPLFHSQPNVPIESHGVFHSSLTGDDYVCVGRTVRDLSNNIVLPTSLFREHARNKMSIRRRKWWKILHFILL